MYSWKGVGLGKTLFIEEPFSIVGISGFMYSSKGVGLGKTFFIEEPFSTVWISVLMYSWKDVGLGKDVFVSLLSHCACVRIPCVSLLCISGM